MKKNYDSPCTQVYTIVGQTHLMDPSPMKVDSKNKVNNTSDIGFVKDNTANQDYNVWDDDWSAEQ